MKTEDGTCKRKRPEREGRPSPLVLALFNPGRWAFFAITAASFVVLNELNRRGELDAARDFLGLLAPLVAIPIHVIVSVSPIPSDLIGVANGSFHGVFLGAACSWLGWYISAVICFWIGRRITNCDSESLRKKLPKWMRDRPFDHPIVLILTRQIPGVGGYLTTLGAGALGVHWYRHLWCSAIAILPGAINLALIGNYLSPTQQTIGI